MLRATLGSGRLRASSGQSSASPPTFVKKQVVSVLRTISHFACTHPIRTVVFFAIIASTTYISLLESKLFEPPTSPNTAGGKLGFETLLSGSKVLHVSQESSWKWQNGDFGDRTVDQDLALLTLVFPDVSSNGLVVAPPDVSSISLCDNSTIKSLPSSKNLLTPISQEKTLAFSVPISLAPKFVNSLHELPISKFQSAYQGDDGEADPSIEGKRWMLSAVKGDTVLHQRSFGRRVTDAWTAFVDVLKNAEELDITIMVLGYLSMHLTFVSLFMSMRRLGSHFWLGATVLLSSTVACLFGIVVTMRFGVPLNVVLLSEGLPFLVVTIGFEKPIVLTKAVLSASLALKRPAPRIDRPHNGDSDTNRTATAPSIQNAIQIAVKETGYEISRDYAIEIMILVAGAASGVQGGLCQFCFLAAWILFFDCVLLFTVYTAILTIKLEINRIKRHVALRRALEEDGVSRKVAEEVASSDEWPSAKVGNTLQTLSPPERDRSIFGVKAKDNSISKFKVLMVGGFIAINVINFCTIPFRSGARSAGSTLSSAVTQPPIDPFKVAGNALDSILTAARLGRKITAVTVLTPLKYELEYPAVHYSVPDINNGSIFDMNLANKWLESVTGSGKVVEGILKSFEDPFLSKWILAALGMSLVLNGYLFNAARWTTKDPSQLSDETVDQRNGAPVIPRQGRLGSMSNGSPVQPGKQLDKLGPNGFRSKAGQPHGPERTQEECELMLKEKKAKYLEDEEVIDLALRGKIPGHALEKTLEDKSRAVKIRRAVISRTPATADITSLLEKSELPFKHYDYERVFGACCENVIGYLPLPLGVAGPLTIDGRSYFIPMATTEGVLVASTSRGCKAINAGGGAVTVLTADGMTRGPCVGFQTLTRAAEAKIWLDSPEGQRTMKESFNSTSRFARLQSLKTALAGTYLYIRFKTTTGDAMGMNMISKGVEVALGVMSSEAGFQDMSIISVSGNFCTDKKPAAINWIDGRGKSVVAESIIPGEVVRNVLKSDVNALVELNTSKNLIGSAMAGSIGGFNAHAANIVAALFLATGQDPAQVVESSQCITVMKNLDGNLQISVSMPCIEVGTIGGGTFLPPQASMLDLLGVRGAHPTSPGDNSRQLARIIGAAVLAGELSLCAALAAGHLVRAHMQHNRSQVPTRAPTPTQASPKLAMTSAN